jgi:hypothetical protein
MFSARGADILGAIAGIGRLVPATAPAALSQLSAAIGVDRPG